MPTHSLHLVLVGLSKHGESGTTEGDNLHTTVSVDTFGTKRQESEQVLPWECSEAGEQVMDLGKHRDGRGFQSGQAHPVPCGMALHGIQPTTFHFHNCVYVIGTLTKL